MALWLCRSHFVPDLTTFFLFVLAVSTALCIAGTTWLFYLAVEPWVRRKWPQTIISWSRLLSGQVRDPLVGRDILFGVILGVVWVLVIQIRYIQMMRMGASPGLYSTEYLIGGRQALGAWLYQVPKLYCGCVGVLLPALGFEGAFAQGLDRGPRVCGQSSRG